MKKLNIGLKIILSILTVIAIICSAFFIRSLIQKHRIATRKPILKVIAMSPGGWITSWKEHYYIVYDNGDYKEIGEFAVSEVKTYNLYSYYGSDSTDYPECAKDIIEYAESLDNSNINNLYVTEGRYFFDVHDSRAIKSKYDSTVFEYFPEKNSVKRVVRFKDYYTKHVEIYKPE